MLQEQVQYFMRIIVDYRMFIMRRVAMFFAPKALIFGRASFRYVRPSSVVRLSALFFGTLKTLIYEYDTCLELDEKW